MPIKLIIEYFVLRSITASALESNEDNVGGEEVTCRLISSECWNIDSTNATSVLQYFSTRDS